MARQTSGQFLIYSIIALNLCSIPSCKNPESPDIQPPAPPVPPYSWRTSTYAAQRIEPDSIVLALQEFRDKQYVESFVLVRNGYLVNETYFTLANQYTNANIASVTKGMTSALVGIALREHYIDSLGQKMLDFFPEYVTPTS